MHLLHFHDWTIDIDVQATGAAYAMLSSGEAERCGCSKCRNWISHRSTVFPIAFLDFLQSMGVDPTKETEISEYEGGAIHPMRYLYSGEFLFIGRVLSGPDCFRPQPDGRGCSVELTQLDGIKVGISSNVQWAMTGSASASFQPSSSSAVVVFQLHAPNSAPRS
jgi:hypothetical protein